MVTKQSLVASYFAYELVVQSVNPLIDLADEAGNTPLATVFQPAWLPAPLLRGSPYVDKV